MWLFKCVYKLKIKAVKILDGNSRFKFFNPLKMPTKLQQQLTISATGNTNHICIPHILAEGASICCLRTLVYDMIPNRASWHTNKWKWLNYVTDTSIFLPQLLVFAQRQLVTTITSLLNTPLNLHQLSSHHTGGSGMCYFMICMVFIVPSTCWQKA